MHNHPQYFDDVHSKIDTSLTNMTASAPVFKKVEQAALFWQKQEHASHEAFGKYLEAIDELSVRAMNGTPPTKEIGQCFAKICDVYRQLETSYRLVTRSVTEEIALPLAARMESDIRVVTRLEKDYDKNCKSSLEELKRCERELEKWSKRARRPDDHIAQPSLLSAQQLVDARIESLHQMRCNTLNQVVVEERRRFSSLLLGIVRTIKTQMSYHNESLQGLTRLAALCEPYAAPGDAVAVFVQSGVSAPVQRPPRPSERIVNSFTMPAPQSELHNPQSFQSQRRPTTRVLPDDPFAGLAKNQARAKFAFHASDPAQLSFEAGDVIEADGDPEDNWQFGTCLRTKSSGWFPSHYLYQHPTLSLHVQKNSLPPPVPPPGKNAVAPPADYE